VPKLKKQKPNKYAIVGGNQETVLRVELYREVMRASHNEYLKSYMIHKLFARDEEALQYIANTSPEHHLRNVYCINILAN
jgi:hypothetical protein